MGKRINRLNFMETGRKIEIRCRYLLASFFPASMASVAMLHTSLIEHDVHLGLMLKSFVVWHQTLVFLLLQCKITLFLQNIKVNCQESCKEKNSRAFIMKYVCLRRSFVGKGTP